MSWIKEAASFIVEEIGNKRIDVIEITDVIYWTWQLANEGVFDMSENNKWMKKAAQMVMMYLGECEDDMVAVDTAELEEIIYSAYEEREK